MTHEKKNYFKLKKKYLSFLNKQEVLGEPFYDKIRQLKNYYLPICSLIHKDYSKEKKTIIVGLSGGQGSGKTTISQIITLILKIKYNLNVVSFSIDDFYKTLKERKKLSVNIHKLFLTRGVPGTHDTRLLSKTFQLLLKKKFKSILIPKFDKSIDDRMPKNKWKKIKEKPQVIIFEGWCVGSTHQNNFFLSKPVNTLEKNYDKKMLWRIKINNELKNNYKKIFSLIDKLIFLEVPSFNYVLKWRKLQEIKLKALTRGKKIMSNDQIKNFIMYYERITKNMLQVLRSKAHIVIKIDKKHRLCKMKFN
tara:strand:+ start:159 stop:1076 length:918 start_codon:yes stop_codon:yes gene_type:complete